MYSKGWFPKLELLAWRSYRTFLSFIVSKIICRICVYMKMHIFIAIGIIDKVEVATQDKVRSHEKLVLNMYSVCQSFMRILDEHFSVSLNSIWLSSSKMKGQGWGRCRN